MFSSSRLKKKFTSFTSRGRTNAFEGPTSSYAFKGSPSLGVEPDTLTVEAVERLEERIKHNGRFWNRRKDISFKSTHPKTQADELLKDYYEQRHLEEVENVVTEAIDQHHSTANQKVIDETLHTLHLSLQKVQQQNEGLRQELASLQEKKHEIQSKQCQAEDVITAQNKKLEKAQDDVMGFQFVNNGLKDQIQSAKREIADLNVSLSRREKPQIVQHVTHPIYQYGSLIGQINTLRQKLVRTENQLRECQITASGAVENSQSKELRYQELLDNFQNSIMSQKHNSDELSKRIKELTTQLGQMGEKVKEKDQQVHACEKMLVQKSQTLEELCMDIKNKDIVIEEQNSQVALLQHEAMAKDEYILHIKESFKNVKAQVGLATNELLLRDKALADAKSLLQTKHHLWKDCQQSLNLLTEDMIQKDNLIQSLTVQNAKHQNEFDFKSATERTLSEDIQRKDEMIQRLTDEKAELQRQFEMKSTTGRKQSNKIEALTQELNEREDQMLRMEQEMTLVCKESCLEVASVEEKSLKEISEYKATIDQLREELADKENKLQQIELNNQKAVQQIQHIKAELSTKDDMLDQQEHVIQKEKSHVESKDSLIEEQKFQLQTAIEGIKYKELAVQNATDANSSLLKQLELNASKNEMQLEKIFSLGKDVDAYKEQILNMEHNIIERSLVYKQSSDELASTKEIFQQKSSEYESIIDSLRKELTFRNQKIIAVERNLSTKSCHKQLQTEPIVSKENGTEGDAINSKQLKITLKQVQDMRKMVIITKDLRVELSDLRQTFICELTELRNASVASLQNLIKKKEKNEMEKRPVFTFAGDKSEVTDRSMDTSASQLSTATSSTVSPKNSANAIDSEEFIMSQSDLSDIRDRSPLISDSEEGDAGLVEQVVTERVSELRTEKHIPSTRSIVMHQKPYLATSSNNVVKMKNHASFVNAIEEKVSSRLSVYKIRQSPDAEKRKGSKDLTKLMLDDSNDTKTKNYSCNLTENTQQMKPADSANLQNQLPATLPTNKECNAPGNSSALHSKHSVNRRSRSDTVTRNSVIDTSAVREAMSLHQNRNKTPSKDSVKNQIEDTQQFVAATPLKESMQNGDRGQIVAKDTECNTSEDSSALHSKHSIDRRSRSDTVTRNSVIDTSAVREAMSLHEKCNKTRSRDLLKSQIEDTRQIVNKAPKLTNNSPENTRQKVVAKPSEDGNLEKPTTEESNTSVQPSKHSVRQAMSLNEKCNKTPSKDFVKNQIEDTQQIVVKTPLKELMQNGDRGKIVAKDKECKTSEDYSALHSKHSVNRRSSSDSVTRNSVIDTSAVREAISLDQNFNITPSKDFVKNQIEDTQRVVVATPLKESMQNGEQIVAAIPPKEVTNGTDDDTEEVVKISTKDLIKTNKKNTSNISHIEMLINKFSSSDGVNDATDKFTDDINMSSSTTISHQSSPRSADPSDSHDDRQEFEPNDDFDVTFDESDSDTTDTDSDGDLFSDNDESGGYTPSAYGMTSSSNQAYKESSRQSFKREYGFEDEDEDDANKQ